MLQRKARENYQKLSEKEKTKNVSMPVIDTGSFL